MQCLQEDNNLVVTPMSVMARIAGFRLATSLKSGEASGEEGRKERTPSVEQSNLELPQQVYPTIARWASGYGRVEFGIDGRHHPFVRAEDESGTVWEGEGRYETPDEALGALEAGLKQFMTGLHFG